MRSFASSTSHVASRLSGSLASFVEHNQRAGPMLVGVLTVLAAGAVAEQVRAIFERQTR